MTDVPKLSSMPGATGYIHHVDKAPAYWMQGILWTMLADADDTGGRYTMMEQLLPKGSGPPPHKHLWSDKTFYILDDTITVLLGQRTLPPPAPQMPDELLTRYGLIWPDEPEPLAPRGH